jgi:hypothetical protein
MVLEVHTAQPTVNGPSRLEVQTAITELKGTSINLRVVIRSRQN